jgi:hypothetical protein
MSNRSATEREGVIQERAYAIWEEEGRPHDKALDHWLRAEAENAQRRAIAQRYVSVELSHFVGRGRSEPDQYDLLVNHILKPGRLTHPPHIEQIDHTLPHQPLV